MAIEIYFYAKRAERMAPDEHTRVVEISQKYMDGYKGKEFEGPGCMIGENGDPIFSGDIRLPFDSVEDGLEEFLDYWLEWLTEITRVLAGAEWEVRLEDVPLIWEEKSGWRLMTDEEYGELMQKYENQGDGS